MKEVVSGEEPKYSNAEMTRLSMAGLGRNVGYGTNKVFAADLLSRLTTSQPLIGLVLGLEGALGLVLNPLTGWLSDRYVSRFGRRRLYILISTPLAGILWVLFAGQRDLHLAILFLVTFYFFQQVAPTPLQAWMPDIVPERHWGKASGIINLWWQVGNLLAFLPIPLLWKEIHGGAFWVVAVIMIGTGMLTGLTVRERREQQPIHHTSVSARGRWLNPNLIKYFIAQLMWWLAFEAMASFFTLFMIHTLHGTLIDSALGMTIFTLAAIIVSIWFGRLYTRYSSKRILIIALSAFGLLGFTGTIIRSVPLAFALLFVAGIFWGGIQVVSYPWGSDLLIQGLPVGEDPTDYYGLLYGVVNLMFSGGLLIAAPVAGLLIALDHGAYSAMFWVNVMASIIGVIALASIKPSIPQ
jgi:MFS family permease